MIIRLRAASHGILEVALRRFGILQPEGSGHTWRPARGISLVWLGQVKVAPDVLDPETGEVVTPGEIDPREHVDLLITGPALAAHYHDRETGEEASMAAVDALMLIWTTGGTPVDTNVGMESALAHDGIELIEDIRTPRHVFAGLAS